MNRIMRALSLTLGAAVLMGGALQAGQHRSEPLEIPFDFTVQGKHLPAGTYRLQRAGSERFAALINLRTGKQVTILRSVGNSGNKSRLTFERQDRSEEHTSE